MALPYHCSQIFLRRPTASLAASSCSCRARTLSLASCSCLAVCACLASSSATRLANSSSAASCKRWEPCACGLCVHCASSATSLHAHKPVALRVFDPIRPYHERVEPPTHITAHFDASNSCRLTRRCFRAEHQTPTSCISRSSSASRRAEDIMPIQLPGLRGGACGT
jgi:hypothetical protein